jgi:hypothetical protein
VKEFWLLSRNQFRWQMSAEKVFFYFQLIRPTMRKVPPGTRRLVRFRNLLCFATRGRP